MAAVRVGTPRRILALLAACHPEPAALVTAATGLLALGAGRGWSTLWIVAAVAAGQLGVGWSNDYLDRELDRSQGRQDKPVVNGAIQPTTVRGAAAVALIAAVPLSFASGLGFALAHLAAVAGALAYNAGLKRQPLSVLPYAAGFALLPAAVSLSAGRWPPAWAVLAGALAGAGGHFTQVLPDIAEDRRHGIRGLPQLLGERASAVAAAALLLAANAVIALGPGGPGVAQLAGLVAATALATGIVVATAAGRARLAFRLTLAIAAVAVLAFLVSGRSL
jgi:4-hydroxybenzoate polyprenyltransferase